MKSIFLFAVISLSILPIPSADSSPFRQKIAWVGAFTTGSPDDYLTDQFMSQGADAFFLNYPEAKSRIDLIKFDNHGIPEMGLQLIHQIRQKNIPFIIGFSKSDQALVVQNEVERNKLLLLLPFATNPMLTKGMKFVFRTCASDDVLGEKIAEFAKSKLKAKRPVILRNIDSLYSQGLAAVIQRQYLNKLPTFDYSLVALENSSLTTFVRSNSPDFVFIPDLATAVTRLIEPIRELFPNIKYLGGDGWGDHDILNGILTRYPDIEAYYTTQWHQDIQTPTNAKFISTLTRVTGNRPAMPGGAVMYDALVVFWTAFRSSGYSSSAERVAQQLRSQAFESTTGSFSYTKASGNSPSRPVAVIKIEQKRHKLDAVY